MELSILINRSNVHILLIDGGFLAGGVRRIAADILVEMSGAGYSQVTNHYTQPFLVSLDVLSSGQCYIWQSSVARVVRLGGTLILLHGVACLGNRLGLDHICRLRA